MGKTELRMCVCAWVYTDPEVGMQVYHTAESQDAQEWTQLHGGLIDAVATETRVEGLKYTHKSTSVFTCTHTHSHCYSQALSIVCKRVSAFKQEAGFLKNPFRFEKKKPLFATKTWKRPEMRGQLFVPGEYVYSTCGCELDDRSPQSKTEGCM